MDINLTHADIRRALQCAYDECRAVSGGKNADYIPYLSHIDPTLFGISITLLDGTTFSVGDTACRFGIESISKVLTAILALDSWGPQAVLKRIGADATGLPFNSIMAMLLDADRPSTPLVNAGAISTCSLVRPQGDAAGKWKAINDNVAALCGSGVTLIDELYKSETECNYNNRAIAWMLKKYGRIYDDVELSLDLYTRQCSLGVTAEQLSVCAATIANDGVNPVTGKRAFSKGLMPKIVSLIATEGFYQSTGDWLYNSGIPAKSGVGGGVMGVLPGVMGISAFAPPLDHAGNSVKAQAAVKSIMNRLQLGVFNGNRVTIRPE